MTFDEFLRAAAPPLDLAWRKYRRRAARHRVQNRLRELDLADDDYATYLARLHADPAEAAALADRMRVTVSRFFRDRQHWNLLATRVIPHLLELQEAGTPLQVWSCGCAGGEEPYTLALVWLAGGHDLDSLRIVATDIDEASLERARRAVYGRSSLREVPEELRRRYFRAEGEIQRLVPEVAATVEFARHNLLTDSPPGCFHLACCRYLPFTYFTGERRRQAAGGLHRALVPGGVLMIGAKENFATRGTPFHPFPGAPGFFLAASS